MNLENLKIQIGLLLNVIINDFNDEDNKSSSELWSIMHMFYVCVVAVFFGVSCVTIFSFEVREFAEVLIVFYLFSVFYYHLRVKIGSRIWGLFEKVIIFFQGCMNKAKESTQEK